MVESQDARHRVVDTVTMILAAISDVAPELQDELADLDHDADLWTTLQLDSMDHLAVMSRLAAQSGREIEERDFPRLTTVNALRDHLSAASEDRPMSDNTCATAPGPSPAIS